MAGRLCFLISIPSRFLHEIETGVIDRIAHTSVKVNAKFGESDSLLLLYRVSDYSLDDFMRQGW